MATPITDSNSIQLGLQNDESNLLQATVLAVRQTFDFLTRLREIDLTIYIYIYSGDFGRTPAYEVEKLAEGRSVGEREIGWSRWLNSSLEIELLRLERGWLDAWIADSWAVFRFIRSAG